MADVLSAPTMCLRCHVVAEMVLREGGRHGLFWQCPRCPNVYHTKHWIVKRAPQKRAPRRDPKRAEFIARLLTEETA